MRGVAERELTDWERGVLERLASVDGDGVEIVRESVPHVVVTGGCGCGCLSFNLRDRRHPVQPHELFHFANGWTDAWSFMLYLGPDGRPIAVDAELRGDEVADPPDPADITVASPYR